MLSSVAQVQWFYKSGGVNSRRYISGKARRQVKMSLANQERKVFRPLIDDVERLSKGDGARKRGTGSRIVPHRLNADERKMYEIAKRNDYLQLRGTGYRKERKGSPLANIWRQWCDAKAMPCVLLVSMQPERKIVMVDLSTLRRKDCGSNVRPLLAEFVNSQKGCEIDSKVLAQYMPFTIADMQVDKWYSEDSFRLNQIDADLQQSPQDLKIRIVTQQEEVDQQAEKVRQLKNRDGLTNQDPEVQQQVKELLELKQRLKELQQQFDKATKYEEQNMDGEGGQQEEEQEEDSSQHPLYTHAIWQIPAYLMGFEGGEQSERQLAEAIVKWAK